MDHLLNTTTNKDAYIIPPYARDIRLIILTYLSHHTLSLSQFKSHYKRMQFSQIHNATPDDVDRHVFTRSLFDCVNGYFVVRQHTFAVKLAALYTLYLIYETQPLPNEQKTKIPITPHVFYELLLLREDIKKHKVYDAFHCLNRLSLLKAFIYTMHSNIDLTISCVDPPAEFIPDISKYDSEMKEKWQWGQFAEMVRLEEGYWESKERFFEYLKERDVDEADLMLDAEDDAVVATNGAGGIAEPVRAQPFSRLSKNLVKELKASIDDQMVQREEQLKIFRTHAILDAKRDVYASIEQLAMAPHGRQNAAQTVPVRGRATQRIAKTFQQQEDYDEDDVKAEQRDSDDSDAPDEEDDEEEELQRMAQRPRRGRRPRRR